MAPTPYGLSIIDVTTGIEVLHVGSGSSASVSITQTTAGPHRYVGFVSNANGANAQAASVPVVVFWGGTLPTVSGVSPASGSTAGGTSVSITGTNLTGATAVRFGATNATAFTVNSATSITATAPAAGAGVVDITVTTPTGTSGTGTADQFTYQTPAGPPTVSGVSPAQGPLAGGTAVTITGTGFTGASAVAFGANPATTFSVISPTSISATAPAGSAGTVHVTVTNGIGTSSPVAADQFTYVTGNPGPPTITRTSPISGPSAGGTSVVITGTNFLNATSVQFGSVNATSYTVNSPTQITATAPAGTTTVDVTVVTPQGTSAHGAPDEYTYTFSNNGYAITLSASTASPAAGGSVVLTATANKDVGPTPYGLSIIDVTTGTELLHVGSGATASATVSNVASTHRYVAMVSNAGGANAQAASTPVVVTWH